MPPVKDQTKKKRILIIDDEKEITSMLKLRLELESHQVFDFTSIKNGVKLVKEIKPHLILCDIVLDGEENGLDFCLEVKSQSDLRSIPFYLITAGKLPNSAERGLSCGAQGIFFKPWDEQVIMNLV